MSERFYRQTEEAWIEEQSRERAEDVWDDSCAPGGYVCGACGMPTESEPCGEHQGAFTLADETILRVTELGLQPQPWQFGWLAAVMASYVDGTDAPEEQAHG